MTEAQEKAIGEYLQQVTANQGLVISFSFSK
jgi:hypothetical protein